MAEDCGMNVAFCTYQKLRLPKGEIIAIDPRLTFGHNKMRRCDPLVCIDADQRCRSHVNLFLFPSKHWGILQTSLSDNVER